MYNKLLKINQKPKPFEYYTTETLWNDPHISKHMLALHLDESVDPASRKKEFIERSALWIAERFKLGMGTNVCDFGCGPGLYTTRFAETGASVTGIDFSSRSIEYARKAAGEKNLDINYIQQNYLDFSSHERFDLITMIYCDLCVLSPEQRKRLLGIFYNHLAPGGLVLLDVFSIAAYNERKEAAIYEYNMMNGFWSPNDYFCFMNTFKYDDEKVVLDKYTIIEENRRFSSDNVDVCETNSKSGAKRRSEENRRFSSDNVDVCETNSKSGAKHRSEPDKEWEVYNWLQYYDFEILEKEFNEMGFKIIERYSDVSGAVYTGKTPETAIVAVKG